MGGTTEVENGTEEFFWTLHVAVVNGWLQYTEHLQQLLKNCGIHKDDIKNIVNYASNNHYNKACSIFFDCMHKLPEGGLGEFITHPNQYFDESRKLYSRSSSKNRFMPGENQTF
ncbi:DNA primase large subunit [Trichinella patagoniensis]|uniref:DNA primase large subunit n=1 Tax=Trichinella patagoniensis TaxID=990121 RepID=A0A0V0Z6N9_9BILA|nr:DNA primase large subunit [Trichinella patagoniensis]